MGVLGGRESCQSRPAAQLGRYPPLHKPNLVTMPPNIAARKQEIIIPIPAFTPTKPYIIRPKQDIIIMK